MVKLSIEEQLRRLEVQQAELNQKKLLEKVNHENKSTPKVGDSRTNDPAWLDMLPRYTVIKEAKNPHNPIPLIAQKTEEDRWQETLQNMVVNIPTIVKQLVITLHVRLSGYLKQSRKTGLLYQHKYR
ncbi:hypothetical protein BOVMAS05_08800 [Streptococcus uberis]